MSCNGTKEATADALFITLGYSASEAELGGITVGYKINAEAISEYEAVTGVELSYGVFAASYDYVGNNDVVDANGTPIDGVIAKDAKGFDLDALNLKLVGFDTEDLMKAEIVMGMYVSNGTSVSYVQPKALIDTNKYYVVSYNSLIGKED